MTELTKILTALGVEIFGEVGEAFDPNMHNAVMHTEDENFGENTISLVFQKGFRIGERSFASLWCRWPTNIVNNLSFI